MRGDIIEHMKGIEDQRDVQEHILPYLYEYCGLVEKSPDIATEVNEKESAANHKEVQSEAVTVKSSDRSAGEKKEIHQLLNQLFEFARIEADEMDFSYTTFDLNAVLRSVAVSFFKSFEERKIIPVLSIAEISFPFYGDEKAVTRIFENIISNALSHGKSDYHFFIL